MVWGAFNNATQGMMAHSTAMGTISQNIANVNTSGYKHSETLFKTLLSGTHATPSGASGGLDIFSTKAVNRTHVQHQGVLTPTYNWSDLAIAGRGFFMVAPQTSPGALPASPSVANPNAVMYTRAGAFNQIAMGTEGRNYFVTGSNHHLLGYMADQTGQLTSTTLEPLYTLPTTTMPGRPTAAASIVANLPADAPLTPANKTSTVTMTTGQTGTATPQNLEFTWTRTGPTDWSVTVAAPAGAVVDPATTTFAVSIDGYGNVMTNPDSFAVNVDWSGLGGNAAATHSFNTAQMQPPGASLQKITMPVYDSDSNIQSMILGFERVGANEWYLHVANNPTPLTMTFTADGRLLTGSPGTINATFTNTSGTPPVTTTSTADFTLDMDKLTQFNGDLYIGAISQDGYSEGLLRHARFNAVGDLVGTFDNGHTMRLARVPLATFVSENNLAPVNGTLFMRTLAAGDISVDAVEDVAGGATRLAAESLETSTVDIADEFTRMIMTQKAYSTNATVFKTADDMISEARDLKG